MKKITIIILCSIIAFSPLLTLGNFSFAADDDYPSIGGGGGGTWTNINNETELVAAFKAYCGSRNFDVSHEPNTVKAIVNWDYNNITRLAEDYNIDLTGLNAHIWYAYDSNGFLQWYIDSIGLSTISGIYGAIVTENNIIDKDQVTLYSGEAFQADGEICYVFYANSTGTPEYTKRGTYFKYVSYPILQNMGSATSAIYSFNIHNNTLDVTVNKTTDNYGVVRLSAFNDTTKLLYIEGTDRYQRYTYKRGGFCICKVNGNYYLSTSCDYKQTYLSSNTAVIRQKCGTGTLISEPDVEPANITANQGEPTIDPPGKSLEVQTSDTTINNYITNNDSHDTYNYDDDDEPPKKKPDPLPPTDNFPTGVTDPNGDPFNFTMPNIGIDWNLQLDPTNLPFPFSIPHDIIRFLTILDSEPEAPHYEIHTEILNTPVDLDIDLSVFDDGMVIIRNIILAGYCLFLIISTRALFHIY